MHTVATLIFRVTTPLKKEINEMENVEEKNPDIVPTEDGNILLENLQIY